MANLTWKDIEDKLEQMNFSVGSWSSNGNLYQVDIEKYYDGSDQVFNLSCDKDNPASVVEALKMLYDNFDVDYETYLWLDNDGHGKNGAP